MIHQVNKVLIQRNLLRQFLRSTHKDAKSASKTLYPLESRRLLRVAGSDAKLFLQGLITNDMRHFEDGAKTMYAMFLNNRGRVLYDTLIHKYGDDDCYMLECDKVAVNQLQRHLKMYKLKRNVEIGVLSSDFKVWAFIGPPTSMPETNDPENDIQIYKDPRLIDLGFRIITSDFVNRGHMKELVGDDTVIEDSEIGYKYLRYTLGVSEGPEDLPPGVGFPLEANCDYMHGVSFHKGCYIGQELTARVHHTGVVRKRIMPLKFYETIRNLKINSTISTSDHNPKPNIGKLVGYIKNIGIGLVRIKEAMEAESLLVDNKYPVEVDKPTWWPVEAPKEKVKVNKLET